MFKLSKKKNVLKYNDLSNNLNHLSIQIRLQKMKKNLKNKYFSSQNSFLGNNISYNRFSSSSEQNIINNSSFKSIINNKSKINNRSSFSKSPTKGNITVFNDHIISSNNSSKEKKNITKKKNKTKLLIKGKFSKFDLDLYRKKIAKTDIKYNYCVKKIYPQIIKNNIHIPFKNCLLKSKLNQFYNGFKILEPYNCLFSYNKSFEINAKNSRNNQNENQKTFDSFPILSNKGKTLCE